MITEFDLTIENKYYLILLLIVPLMFFLHFYYYKFAKKRAMKFANFEALKRVSGNSIISKNLTSLLFRSLLMIFIILSLTEVSLWHFTESTSMDYVILLDSGGSMNAIDVEPNRFGLAKEFANSFITNTSTNIGFVSFAGSIIKSNRIVSENKKILELIAETKIKESGTDIGLAISSGMDKSDDIKTLILISDGHDTVGIPLGESIKRAVEEHTQIITIGVGTEEGGNFITGPGTPNLISKLNSKNLKLIANSTNGKYFELKSKEDIPKIIKGLNIQTEEQYKKVNMTNLFLLAIFILSFVEWVLSNTRFRILP